MQQPKLPTLNELSRQRPTKEEIDNYYQQMDKQPGRVAAVALGALVEALLEDALMANMLVLDDARFDELFRKPEALLSSWSAKTMLAHVLGIIPDRMRPQMDCVRKIRYAFAHALKPLDFDNPTISAECSKLDCRLMARAGIELDLDDTSPRGRFFEACTFMALHLTDYIGSRREAVNEGRQKSRVAFQSRFA